VSDWQLGLDPAGWPSVSVVMPVRNEAVHLRGAVEAVLGQEYPRRVDVCLAVGPSDDGTEMVAAALAAAHEHVTVVDNPSGTTPAALNAAIGATDGEVVVRVDGHAQLCDGYIRRAVETMRRTGAVNVGGVQQAVGQTSFESAVAAAMASWLGTGGSRFHVGGSEGPVDTVYLGVFRRSAVEAVGLFADDLIRNQDYELNIRLRAAGGVVWFDPALRVVYRPRGSIRALARQYGEYGWWKAEVARRHPSSLRVRQVIPPLVVVALTVAVPLAGRSRAARAMLLLYGVAVAGSAARARRARLLVVHPTVHVCWAAGFVAGVLGGRRAVTTPRRARRGAGGSTAPTTRRDGSSPRPPRCRSGR
jgi:succinoglycan biosynthesis protein ExoA